MITAVVSHRFITEAVHTTRTRKGGKAPDMAEQTKLMPFTSQRRASWVVQSP